MFFKNNANQILQEFSGIEHTIKKVKSNIDNLLSEDLTDLIKGIRNNKERQDEYISQCVEEIKEELQQDSIQIKSQAISKLTYLQMLGVNINWAAFNIIEVMSSSKFTHKRIGYMSASQSFNPNTEVLMLTTNMIKKDLNSSKQYEASTAMSGLSSFIDKNSAAELSTDLTALLTSTKAYIRKRAVIMMFHILAHNPLAFPAVYPKLKSKLEDSDPGVQSAAVNVICELAKKSAESYIPLTPIFFKLMSNSNNNWMLIKIIKFFGVLIPLEPRLGQKLVEPLTNLINNTTAMSLLYECINCLLVVIVILSSSSPSNHKESIQLCLQKLRILIEDHDQNLKYLGLLAMSKVLTAHPESVLSQKDIILACLDDLDDSIKFRALHLILNMISKANIMSIMRTLLLHVEKCDSVGYRNKILPSILSICKRDKYHLIPNFEWYLCFLLDLTRFDTTDTSDVSIAESILDITMKVPSIRAFAVQKMAAHMLECIPQISSTNASSSSCCEVYRVAAFICGEFNEHILNSYDLLEVMLSEKVHYFPAHVQSTFLQNIPKVYYKFLQRSHEDNFNDENEKAANKLISCYESYTRSDSLEVQERSITFFQLFTFLACLDPQNEFVSIAKSLFSPELTPVADVAQGMVKCANNLNLDQCIFEQFSISDSDECETECGMFSNTDNNEATTPYDEYTKKFTYSPVSSSDASQRVNTVELASHCIDSNVSSSKIDRFHNPNYLKDVNNVACKNFTFCDGLNEDNESIDLNAIPIEALDMEDRIVNFNLTSDAYLPHHTPSPFSDKQEQLSKSSKKKSKKEKSKTSNTKVSPNTLTPAVEILEPAVPLYEDLGDNNLEKEINESSRRKKGKKKSVKEAPESKHEDLLLIDFGNEINSTVPQISTSPTPVFHKDERSVGTGEDTLLFADENFSLSHQQDSSITRIHPLKFLLSLNLQNTSSSISYHSFALSFESKIFFLSKPLNDLTSLAPNSSKSCTVEIDVSKLFKKPKHLKSRLSCKQEGLESADDHNSDNSLEIKQNLRSEEKVINFNLVIPVSLLLVKPDKSSM